MPDAELDGARLVAEVDALLADPHRLAADGIARHGRRRRPDAADDDRRAGREARPWLTGNRLRGPRAAPTLDLSRPRRMHVANVGGAGMSAVATLLAESGHRVSGHDPAATTPFLPMLFEPGRRRDHRRPDRRALGDERRGGHRVHRHA